MSVKLLTATPPTWHTITLAEGVTVNIAVRNPSWKASNADLAYLFGKGDIGEKMLARIEAVVCDWSDVEQQIPYDAAVHGPVDQGPYTKPIPFSWDALHTLAAQFPALVYELQRLANIQFNQRVEETASKN